MDLLEQAKQKLIDSDACLVCLSDRVMHISFERGIAPLFHLMDTRKNALKGAIVADKVVGKAAALLMVHGGVKSVFASTISQHAIEVFLKAAVSFEYNEAVPYIVNRRGDGMCPMESHVLDTDDPSRAYHQLKLKVMSMPQ